MRLLIVASTEDSIRNILGLTNAAINNGYNVTLFFNEKSVFLLKKPSLLNKINATKLVCRTSFNELGLKNDDLITETKMSSLAELVELFEKHDKVVYAG